MKFIDTHIHLQDFKPDFAPRVLDNPEAKQLVLVSASTADFDKIAELVTAYPNKLIASFGVHPWYSRDEFSVESLKELLKKNPHALVGEIGVDELKEKVSDAQHQLFSKQLAVAWTFNRPVIVHAAKAFNALVTHEAELKEVKYVHHAFVKNQELLKFINKTGGYFGLGGLFLKQEKAREMWEMMPKDKILFETDAPYQADEARYNEIVQENLLKLGQIAQMPVNDLSALLIDNAKKFVE